jgi:hypothetical protein
MISHTSSITPDDVEAWRALDNTRRIPSITIRLTEQESAKLKHIAETTPFSRHSFCLKAVTESLQKFLDADAKSQRNAAAIHEVSCPVCKHKLHLSPA